MLLAERTCVFGCASRQKNIAAMYGCAKSEQQSSRVAAGSAVEKPLLPALQELHTAMESHLRLHFNNESSSDDSVLAIYPTPLRRRILTFL